MIDFTQLGLNTFQKQINPRDIFMGLTNKTEKYQYPRDVQGEVWKQWFEQRNNRDTIIKMNTGSGKTVVALMILQSCLNEGIGPAMYVVPDKYLVEQVISQAKELGIKVIDSETDLDYSRKRAILVTTIQKLERVCLDLEKKIITTLEVSLLMICMHVLEIFKNNFL